MARLSELLQRLSQREKALIAAFVGAAGLIMAKMLVLGAVVQAWDARSQLGQVRAGIARNEALLAELRTGAQRKPASLGLQGYRQANAGLGSFLRTVSGQGRGRRDFSVRKIASQKVEHLPDFDKTRLELEVEGPFESIGAFLEELESSHFLTRVDSIHIYRMEKELRLCRARIMVDNFSWREP